MSTVASQIATLWVMKGLKVAFPGLFPKDQGGTDYVPREGLHWLHRGESVKPAGVTSSEASEKSKGQEINLITVLSPDALASALSGPIGENLVINHVTANMLRNGAIRRVLVGA